MLTCSVISLSMRFSTNGLFITCSSLTKWLKRRSSRLLLHLDSRRLDLTCNRVTTLGISRSNSGNSIHLSHFFCNSRSYKRRIKHTSANNMDPKITWWTKLSSIKIISSTSFRDSMSSSLHWMLWLAPSKDRFCPLALEENPNKWSFPRSHQA